ncbi:MAG: hypothetical protein DWI10_03560, partial [Planctomycetota bacterium]
MYLQRSTRMRQFTMASLATPSLVSATAFMFSASLASAAVVPQSACKQALKPNEAYLLASGAAPANALLFELGQAEWIVEDEFIVEFGDEAVFALESTRLGSEGRVGIEILDDLCVRHGVSFIRKQFQSVSAKNLDARVLPDLSGYAVVTIDLTKTTLEAAMSDFGADPLVRKVETIGIHPIYATPNDPVYGSQWHLNQTSDIDIDAPESWDIQNGDPSKIVAVLDTGVRYYHKDLGGSATSTADTSGTAGNIWINAAEKNGVAGVDDDANGFIDDWVGYDFVSAPIATCWSGEDCTGADNDPRDFNGHGTHCAGIVGAINNNGYAVSSPAGGFGNGLQSTTGDGCRVMCLR